MLTRYLRHVCQEFSSMLTNQMSSASSSFVYWCPPSPKKQTLSCHSPSLYAHTSRILVVKNSTHLTLIYAATLNIAERLSVAGNWKLGRAFFNNQQQQQKNVLMFGSTLSWIYESNNQAQQIEELNRCIYSCICQGKTRRKRLERRGLFRTEGLGADWTNLFLSQSGPIRCFPACPSPWATACCFFSFITRQ